MPKSELDKTRRWSIYLGRMEISEAIWVLAAAPQREKLESVQEKITNKAAERLSFREIYRSIHPRYSQATSFIIN